jgi:hypothetical protein
VGPHLLPFCLVKHRGRLPLFCSTHWLSMNEHV